MDRERAAEIEESAYRNGFPCHESADLVDLDGETEGYVFGEKTQHCAGAMIMYLKDGGDGNVVFENLTDAQQDRIWKIIDIDAPVFDGPDDFLDSYGAAE